MILEIFGMALVDSFLLARKFVPRWQNADDSDDVFWKYVVALLPQIAASHDGVNARKQCVNRQEMRAGVNRQENSGTWKKCRQSGCKATTLCVLR